MAADGGDRGQQCGVQSPATLLEPFLGYLDGFWQLWDKPYRQCLHDKWPRTVVVKVGA